MDAIFLGTFNPPHIGHLNAIQSVLDSEYNNKLDFIYIIPCNQNPNKKGSIPFWIRYRMCTQIFKGIDKVIIDDIESEHDFIYTYNLLKYLVNGKDKFINKDFLWIITEETLREIVDEKWYKSIEILSEFSKRMIILNKSGEGSIFGFGFDKYVKLNPGINIHSTDIRNLVKENKSINLYTKQEVIDIIENEKLYK